MVGLAVGIIRFVLQYLAFPQPSPCGAEEVNKVPDIVGKVHYLHFGCILFLVSFIVVIVVSLLTKPINPRKVGFLFQTCITLIRECFLFLAETF